MADWFSASVGRRMVVGAVMVGVGAWILVRWRTDVDFWDSRRALGALIAAPFTIGLGLFVFARELRIWLRGDDLRGLDKPELVRAAKQARTMTDLMRRSEEDLWARMRDVLREQGYEPDQVALADAFVRDDYPITFGTFVTSDGRVFEYQLEYVDGDRRAADVVAWDELTERWRSTPESSRIEAAFVVLDEP